MRSSKGRPWAAREQKNDRVARRQGLVMQIILHDVKD